MAQVADARHRRLLAQAHAALAGAGDHRAVVGDAEAGADARLVIDVLRLAGADAHLLDDLLHERRHQHRVVAVEVDAGFLLHDLDAGGALERIVRVDHRADAVLELRDDLAGAVEGRRVGREQDQHVDVELDRVAADLHVALFEDVEQADLDQLVQLGDLVHGEDAAVHARDQAEMQGVLGRHAGAAGQLGRVDLADDVGELGARGQPLGVALLPRPPGDGDVVPRGRSATSLPAAA